MSRLLHIVGSMDPATGGVAQAVRTVAAGLEPLGFASEAISLDAPDAAFLGDSSALKIHACGPGKYGWAYNPKFRHWLKHYGKDFSTWIIHGLWLYPSFAAARIHAPPHRLLVYPHGMLDPWFQSWRRRPVKTLRNCLYWHLFESRLVRQADALLFTCEEERRLARTTFFRYRPRAEAVVGLGNDAPPPFHERMNEAFRVRCPQAKGRPYFLFLARLHLKKGVDLLIRAWAHLWKRASAPGGPVLPLLVIAGPEGNDGYGEQMRTLARELLPADAYVFTGMLEGDAKWGALYGADAFVLPSHQENFGIAVVESLACRVPVILSDQVNIWREVVESGGGLATRNSSESLAQTLTRFLEFDDDKRTCLRRNARQCYETYFSAASAAKRIAAAITE